MCLCICPYVETCSQSPLAYRGWRIMNMRNRKIQYSAAIFHFQAIIGLFNWTINWIVRRNAHVALPYLRSNWINVVQDYLSKRQSILAFVRRMRISETIRSSLEYFDILLKSMSSNRRVRTSHNFALLETQHAISIVYAERNCILRICAHFFKGIIASTTWLWEKLR